LKLLFLISKPPSERVAEVEKQLKDQEQEASNAITVWQESCSESDSKCTKLKKELEIVLEEKYSLVKASETIEQDNDELEKEKFALEERVSSLENSMKSPPRENDPVEPQDLEVQLREKDEALRQAQETLQRDAGVLHQWEGKCNINLEEELSETFVVSRQSLPYVNVERVAQLELAIKELERELEQQGEEANDAIIRWEETYTELEEKCSQLEQDLTKAGSADGKELDLQEQVESLSEKLNEAEQQASRAEEERLSMAKTWSTSEITIQTLQDDIERRGESIKRLNAEVETVKSERDESIARLNAEIDIARSELENLRSANAKYTGIQADLEKSKAEVVAITDLLETERDSHLFEKAHLTGELDDEKARYTEARDEVANLTKEVEESRSESEDIVSQWTGKFDPYSQVYSLLTSDELC
jgi:chromosome segregation ATPase